jgi:hypothetical protein
MTAQGNIGPTGLPADPGYATGNKLLPEMPGHRERRRGSR